MKYILFAAFVVIVLFDFIGSISLQNRLDGERAENDNLRFQLAQCRILYKNN